MSKNHGNRLKVGTRGSELARIQTDFICRKLNQLFPEIVFEEHIFPTPGDRDQKTPLWDSPPDFFTRDLDLALQEGGIDLAIHSAKDLPEQIPEGLDYVWLPWREDRRDVLVARQGLALGELPARMRIGVSSERRIDYCRKRFRSARLMPIRGAIPRRIEQLDNGEFDLIVTAAAAMKRLGMSERITEWIALEDLSPPESQGVLALTFRSADKRLRALRDYFVKSVVFAGAGAGSLDNLTISTLDALKNADICLHDTWQDDSWQSKLPQDLEYIDVGKRCGKHSMTQTEICELITHHARQGKRVVRLKSGDPGIYGRLAEEAAALDALHLPYRVLPGVSSLVAATTATGILLTKRGESRGFTVMTPRQAGGDIANIGSAERAKLPLVLFMSRTVLPTVVEELIEYDGWSPHTPAALVFGAGGEYEEVVRDVLLRIGSLSAGYNHSEPALLIVGDCAARIFAKRGALMGARILITASETLQDEAARLIADAGGRAVSRPLIRLEPSNAALTLIQRIDEYDWVVVTSPTAARILVNLLKQAEVDVRCIKKIAAAGSGTLRELRSLGLTANLTPHRNYGTEGLAESLMGQLEGCENILRLASDNSTDGLCAALKQTGARVDRCDLYNNKMIRYSRIPAFDGVLFASSSAVSAYIEQWGAKSLREKQVVAMGRPTAARLRESGVENISVADEATLHGLVDKLIRDFTTKQFMKACL